MRGLRNPNGDLEEKPLGECPRDRGKWAEKPRRYHSLDAYVAHRGFEFLAILLL